MRWNYYCFTSLIFHEARQNTFPHHHHHHHHQQQQQQLHHHPSLGMCFHWQNFFLSVLKEGWRGKGGEGGGEREFYNHVVLCSLVFFLCHLNPVLNKKNYSKEKQKKTQHFKNLFSLDMVPRVLCLSQCPRVFLGHFFVPFSTTTQPPPPLFV